MPSTWIATGEWIAGRERAMIEAVQSALVASLELPEWDREIVLDTYPEHRRIAPTGRSERYTRIEITLFAGRTMKAKRALYRAIVDRLAPLGVPGDQVKITLIEVPLENWGLRGGTPASELDLGIKIDV